MMRFETKFKVYRFTQTTEYDTIQDNVTIKFWKCKGRGAHRRAGALASLRLHKVAAIRVGRVTGLTVGIGGGLSVGVGGRLLAVGIWGGLTVGIGGRLLAVGIGGGVGVWSHLAHGGATGHNDNLLLRLRASHADPSEDAAEEGQGNVDGWIQPSATSHDADGNHVEDPQDKKCHKAADEAVDGLLVGRVVVVVVAVGIGTGRRDLVGHVATARRTGGKRGGVVD